jgi:[protein-PII] uridylyltransferase
MNVFYLQNPDGQAFGRQSDHVLEVLRLKAFKGASGEVNDMKIPKAIISNRAGAIPIVPNVSFFKTASSGILIIEVIAKDRPGLLFDIAEIFRDEHIDVLSAHIEVEGTKAIDVFYVKSCGLESIISDSHQQQLNSMLIKACSSNSINEKVA